MKFKDLVKEYISISEGKDISNGSDGFKGKKIRPSGAPHPSGNPRAKDVKNNSDAFAGKGKGLLAKGDNYTGNNQYLGNASKDKDIKNSSNAFGSAKNEDVELTEAEKKAGKKKVDKKPAKKEEKKAHKSSHKEHKGEQSYKGQFPEGENYNSQYTGRPKSGKNGKLIADKALASCSTEIKKVKAIKESEGDGGEAKKKIKSVKDTFLPHGTTGRVGGRLTAPEGSKYKDEDLALGAEDYAGSVGTKRVTKKSKIVADRKTEAEKEYETAQTDANNPAKKLKDLEKKAKAREDFISRRVARKK